MDPACLPESCGDQKGTPDPMEQDLQTVVSRYEVLNIKPRLFTKSQVFSPAEQSLQDGL